MPTIVFLNVEKLTAVGTIIKHSMKSPIHRGDYEIAFLNGSGLVITDNIDSKPLPCFED